MGSPGYSENGVMSWDLQNGTMNYTVFFSRDDRSEVEMIRMNDDSPLSDAQIHKFLKANGTLFSLDKYRSGDLIRWGEDIILPVTPTILFFTDKDENLLAIVRTDNSMVAIYLRDRWILDKEREAQEEMDKAIDF